jgi:6-phosphofructokinase 2
LQRKTTVGAGITYMLQKERPLREAIRFGVACGSAATMNDGTQLFKKIDAERLFEQSNSTKQ